MIWLLFTMMIAAAVLFGVVPLLAGARSVKAINATARHFERQIREIERDAKDGAISKAEEEALKAEAGRRLLAASDAQPITESIVQIPHPAAAIAIAAIVAAAGVSLYAIKGSPQTPSAVRPAGPAIEAANPPAANVGSVDSMIDNLKSKLGGDPDNADGWRMLGWAYFNTGRYQEAADAYSKAVDLNPQNAGYLSAYGEAQVMAAAGFVTPAALKAFDAALAAGADDPRAAFFKALALDQAGDPAAAIAAWIELANSAPADADWLDGLVQRIGERAAETGVDISGRLKTRTASPAPQAAASGPSRDQVAAAMQMPADERQAMIEDMVARLAARLQENPDDADGWVRLIRSRVVLGDMKQARRDLDAGIAAFSDRPEIRSRIIAEAEALGVVGD